MMQAFIAALTYGNELANSAYWKNVQLATNSLAGLLGALMVLGCGAGICLDVDTASINAVSYGIVSFYGVVNAVLTVVTSAKIGIQKQ